MPDLEVDIRVYFEYADNILHGLVPYRDFALEYPPGALPFFVLAKIPAADVFAFRSYFLAEIMLVDLGGWFLIGRYAEKQQFSPAYTYLSGLFYITLPALIGLVAYQRFDFIPAVLVLWAVVLYSERRVIPAWVMLGVGFAVKLYPAVLAPVFLMAAARSKTWKKNVLAGIPAAVCSAALFWLPAMVAAGSKFWVFLVYHSRRGVQLESFYATALIIAHWFGYPIRTRYAFGAWNISSKISPFLAKLSLPVMAVLTLAVLAYCFRVTRQNGWETRDLPRLSVLVIAVFMIGGKVLSPQYLLWLIPLLVIALNEDSPDRKTIWVITGLLTFFSLLIYPVKYKSLIDLRLGASLLLIGRNALLLAVCYFLFRSGATARQTRKTSDR